MIRLKIRTLVVAITTIIYSRTNLPLRKRRKGDKKNIKNKAAKERPRAVHDLSTLSLNHIIMI